MSWMEPFQTLVNGLSILDYCCQELYSRGCEGPGSDSWKQFIYSFYLIFKFAYKSYLLLIIY